MKKEKPDLLEKRLTKTRIRLNLKLKGGICGKSDNDS
jgi:hypothetical protein